MSRRQQVLVRRVARIKERIAALGDLHPRTLSKQYNVCGTPGCKCKGTPPVKHGPYFQLSWGRKGKTTTRFIRAPQAPRIRSQLRNYKALHTLIDEWIDAAMELGEIELQEARRATSPSLKRG